MSSVITWIINMVRIVVLAIILIMVSPVLMALMAKKIEWAQAVDSLFSNWVITLLIVVLVLSLLISIFRSPIARVILSASLVAAIVCFVTGTVTIDSVRDSVAAYNLAGVVKDTADKCHMDIAVENFGGKFRAVVKQPDAEKVVGYVTQAADGVISILDPSGKPICGAPPAAASK